MTQPSADAPKKRKKKKPAAPAAKSPPNPTRPRPKPERRRRAMTFWEHLEELRKRLIRSVLAFIGGCLVAWEMKEKILAVLLTALRRLLAHAEDPRQRDDEFQAPQARRSSPT